MNARVGPPNSPLWRHDLDVQVEDGEDVEQVLELVGPPDAGAREQRDDLHKGEEGKGATEEKSQCSGGRKALW